MAFAEADDVATRLGRDFSEEEEETIDQLIESAQSLIAEAANKDDEWVESYDAPVAIKELTIQMVIRTFRNPEGLLSESETLGQRSRSSRFPDPGEGSTLFLSDAESRFVRRVVDGGGNSGTSIMGSILDDIPEWVTQPPTTWIGSMTGEDGDGSS